MIVEVVHKDFEFYIRGKPTGHYMRGEVIGEMPKEGKFKIKPLLKGDACYVDVKDIIVVK